jgi:hypothetical protein
MPQHILNIIYIRLRQLWIKRLVTYLYVSTFPQRQRRIRWEKKNMTFVWSPLTSIWVCPALKEKIEGSHAKTDTRKSPRRHIPAAYLGYVCVSADVRPLKNDFCPVDANGCFLSVWASGC